jgi:hypothetical protein
MRVKTGIISVGKMYLFLKMGSEVGYNESEKKCKTSLSQCPF